MKNKKIAIGAIAGASAVAALTLCLCLGNKKITQKGSVSSLSTNTEQSDAIYVENPETGEPEEFDVVSISEIRPDDLPSQHDDNNNYQQEISDEESAYVEPDMTYIYESSIESVFGEDEVVITPCTETGGCIEGGIR